jgi:hypothetical protein
MKRIVGSALGGFALVAAGVLTAVSPAQASITSCSTSSSGVSYSVRCVGNPATSPNQYKAWVSCSDSSTHYGLWETVDFSDSTWSTATCTSGTITAKGYSRR